MHVDRGQGISSIKTLIGAAGTDSMEVDQEEPTEVIEEDQKLLTLGPLDEDHIPPHNSVFVNEFKLSDFKQILQKHNINSEFSGGVLWCSNGTLALKRVDTGKVTMEGCLSDDYYKIRELLYEQYAIICKNLEFELYKTIDSNRW